jgi:prepilin-type N-terminal cleavage/methylation domain-containing protein
MTIIKNLGFTITELIIAIVILGILAALLSIKLLSTSTNLHAQAAQLANDIRYTQSLSMARNDRYKLITTSSNYSIKDGSDNTISTTTFESGMSFTASNTIIFNSKGTPYINDTTPLTSTMTMTLQTSDSTASVSIAPTTGRVTIS